MSGLISFNIRLKVTNLDQLAEISARFADMSVPFQDIIEKWAAANPKKFEEGEGKELTGANVDPFTDVFWEHLTGPYIARKEKEGFPDSIMVRTGELRDALSDVNSFASAVMAQQAIFGIPNDPDVAARAFYNFEKRQTIFLGEDDLLMIKKTIQDYLSLGENYEAILFAQGMAAKALRDETAQMDVEFGGTLN